MCKRIMTIKHLNFLQAILKKSLISEFTGCFFFYVKYKHPPSVPGGEGV